MTFLLNFNNPAIWGEYWINEIEKSSERAKKLKSNLEYFYYFYFKYTNKSNFINIQYDIV